jgi:nucleoside-diphosphate-sugar epimerase
LAANAAGVRRLVYLSSASVHGQAPDPGTTENSPLHTKHPHPYNNAKVQAESILSDLRSRYATEVVILRPGIVFGPRSRWTFGIADDLLQGKAYLLAEGRGICNSIYVDNLNHAILLAATAEKADKQAFLVSDKETVTWRDFYSHLARALNVDMDSIPQPPLPQFKRTRQDRVLSLRANPLVQAVLPHISPTIKNTIKEFALPRETSKPSAWHIESPPQPVVTYEMAMLQQCSYKLPNTKAEQLLGYEPPVSFSEGCKRSIGWLEFAGYPVNMAVW